MMKNCKRRQIALGMAWVDYKKAYNMIHACTSLVVAEMLRNGWRGGKYGFLIGRKYERVEDGNDRWGNNSWNCEY